MIESQIDNSQVNRQDSAPVEALSVRDVCKSFGEHQALVNVGFDLQPGELLVALGPSGCGKTTLLRIIAGLESAEHGEIWLGSRRIDTLAPKDRDLSLVFQNYALYPHMTVAQNLAFPLKVKKVAKDKRLIQVNKIAEMLRLEDQLGKRPGQLSGGQRQRVALGRAIIRQPKLFLLDEPLSNLDTELRAHMRREIVSLQKSLHTPAIYVTHDQTEALTMADQILVLKNGHMRQLGTPDEIYNSPADTFVAAFVGAPKMNFVTCNYQTDSLGRSSIAPMGVTFESLYPKSRSAALRSGESFVLGVRPEAIIVGPLGEFKGRIKEVEFLGDRRVATMFFADTEITFYTDSKSFKPGADISFNLKKDNLHFFDAETGRRLGL
jgi:ABC-type sugar transport system ATPase subunit